MDDCLCLSICSFCFNLVLFTYSYSCRHLFLDSFFVVVVVVVAAISSLFEESERERRTEEREKGWQEREKKKKNCSVPSFSFTRSFAQHNWHENAPLILDELRTRN